MVIKQSVYDMIKHLADDESIVVTDETALIGSGGPLDSLKLVELCIQLEDFADENNFDFDWTSDAAMSRSRSMFRTAGTLADAFIEQMRAKS